MSFKKKAYLISATFLILLIIQASGLILHPTFASESTDITAPTVTISVSPSTCTNNGSCAISFATITVSCTDNVGGSGCNGAPSLSATDNLDATISLGTITYSDTNHTATATVTTAQTYNLSASASDLVGNSGTTSYTFTITSPCNTNQGNTCSVTSSANNCGTTSSASGTYQCNGTCSAAAPLAPANVDLTGTCTLTSVANNCGTTNTASSTWVCDTAGTGRVCNGVPPVAPAACNPPTPTITVTPSCINDGYDGSGISISWTNNATPATYVNISTSDTFTTYYHKAVTGAANTNSSTRGTGFNLPSGTGLLSYNPNTTYYVRLWDSTNHSLTATIPSISACCTACAANTCTSATECGNGLAGTCTTTTYNGDRNCVQVTNASCQVNKSCTSDKRCVNNSCVYSAWIKVTGDVHSNTRINAPGGP